ncbi:MAG TPA: helix-turn-helix transcriptional regulator [Candidatus Scatomorpha merdigallinarum]|nr:helix-turn-helix transcriptional regulator [Candidatus Scatomorpha merdigallinarum]
MLENLKELRKATKTTQTQLAEAIGVSQQSINKYENHNIEPDIETLKRIATYFNTTIDYIVGYTELRFKPDEIENYALNADEVEMIEVYRRLSGGQREAVRAVMRAFLET